MGKSHVFFTCFVCLSLYTGRGYLHDHKDEPPPKECLDLAMICIAILDGARLVGFDVGDLEEELDKSLSEIERKTS